MNLLNELEYIGKFLGSSIDLVQAGGGNISIKEDNALYIKSSGCILSEITTEFGFSKVSLNKLNSLLNSLDSIPDDKFGGMLSEVLDGDYKRPSIETPLHGIIPFKYVIHIHPISVLALTSKQDSQSIIKEHFNNSVWIDYVTPGKDLAISFKKKVNKDAKLYFLQNHGIVVAGEILEETMTLLLDTIKECYRILNVTSPKFEELDILTSLKKVTNQNLSLFKNENKELVNFFNKNNKYQAICPDDVVYIGPKIFETETISTELFANFVNKYGNHPKVIFYNNNFYFIEKNLIKAKQVYEQFYSNIAAAAMIDNHHPITDKEIQFLSNWEAEKYRQNLKG